MSWSNIEDTVVPLERHLYGHLLAGLLWERQFEVPLGLGWEKVPNWECFFIENKDYSYWFAWMTWLERCRIWLPCGRKWWKHLIWTNQLHFLIEYLGCTRRECKPKEVIIDEHAKMYESRNSAGATEKLPVCEKPHAKTVAWSYDYGRTCSKNALKDLAIWQKDSNYTKSRVVAWMIIISRKRNVDQLENCPRCAHKLSWNACTWHELVGLTFYDQWTNLLDQSPNGQEHVTEYQLAWFPTFITRMTTDSNIVMWVSRLSSVGWFFFPRLRFCRRPRRFWKSTSGGISCIFGSRTFVTISWMCKKTNFSIPQFYRIRNHFVGCWTATGWIICSGFMGRGDGSVTFVEQYQTPTNPAAGNCSRNHKSNPKQNGSEMLINCRMWATLPQTHTLLKVSLSCTILKTTKLWSKWWLRAEVQQCDTWDDHQRKLHTWWVGPSSSFVEHHESLSAFPQPFSFKAESKVSSPREFKKVLWKRGRQWRSRDLWILYQRTSWMRRKILRKIRVIQTAWKNQELDQSSKGDWCSFSHDPASGHRCAERKDNRPLLQQKRRHRLTGRYTQKVQAAKERVLLE